MSIEFQIIICILFMLLIICLLIISYCIYSLNYDFNEFRKEYKEMSQKDEEKLPKLVYYRDKCFLYLSCMKTAKSIEEFNRHKVQFEKFYNLFLKEQQMLLYFDEKIGG